MENINNKTEKKSFKENWKDFQNAMDLKKIDKLQHEIAIRNGEEEDTNKIRKILKVVGIGMSAAAVAFLVAMASNGSKDKEIIEVLPDENEDEEEDTEFTEE